MQDMFRKDILQEMVYGHNWPINEHGLLFTKLGWVYHYNAIPDNHNSDKTLYWMKKTYDFFYKK